MAESERPAIEKEVVRLPDGRRLVLYPLPPSPPRNPSPRPPDPGAPEGGPPGER
jgi:hypothetical protein